jgi:hypothetical protein
VRSEICFGKRFYRRIVLLADLMERFLLSLGFFGTYVIISLSKRGDTGFNKWLNKVPLNYTLGWMPGEPSQPWEECAIL